MQHRTRDVPIRQRTQIINVLRAHLGRAGLVAAQGNAGVNELRAIVTGEQDTRLPIDARASVMVLAAQLEALESVTERSKSGSRCSIALMRRLPIPNASASSA
jgi:transposase